MQFPLGFFIAFFLVCAWQDANAPGSTIELSKMQMSSVCVFFFQPLSGVLNRFASAGYFGTHCFD